MLTSTPTPIPKPKKGHRPRTSCDNCRTRRKACRTIQKLCLFLNPDNPQVPPHIRKYNGTK